MYVEAHDLLLYLFPMFYRPIMITIYCDISSPTVRVMRSGKFGGVASGDTPAGDAPEHAY